MPCPPPLPRESPSPSQIKKKYVGKENDKKWEKEDVRRKNTFRATPPPTQFTCHEFNSPPTSSHYWHQFWGDEVVLCQIFLTEDNILLSTSSNFSFWNLNLKEIIEGSIPSDPFSLAPPPFKWNWHHCCPYPNYQLKYFKTVTGTIKWCDE